MTDPRPNSPTAVYEDRRQQRAQAALERERIAGRLSWVRLAIFVAGAILIWAVAFRGVHFSWVAIPVAGFLAVAAVHDRVLRGRDRARRAEAFYARGLDRIHDRWVGQGSPGAGLVPPTHPYANDLDLFGRGSLFELLDVARTRGGERMLARWLCDPADAGRVLERQQAVAEFSARLDLREQLWLEGDDVRSQVDPEGLVAWATVPRRLVGSWPVAVAAVLAGCNVAAVLAWLVSPLYLLVSAAASLAFAGLFRARVHAVLHDADRPERDLRVLARILSRLESESFDAPMLSRLRQDLDVWGRPPSKRIARLARLIELQDSRRNMLFLPLSAVLLLGTQLAFAIERWRARSGTAVGVWLEALARIEAIGSLAGYAYEHPDDSFPEIVEDEPCFDGQGLAHPLLAADRCIANDVRLDSTMRLLLVSGSNMSGKSTLLRTVGVNAVLALAGAPVRARRLRLSPMRIGASLRIHDSLQEGTSHFMAEIKRLRVIADLTAGDRPVLFLLDEILHGTNSADRRAAAGTIVEGLVERGGLGLVTTHDLALARIVDELAPRAANVHFADRVEGETLVFDYRLRDGVVDHGNALALLKAVDLWNER